MLNRVNRILQAGIAAAKTSEGRSRIEDIRICTEGFAEPGYDDPPSGIIAFGNWNTLSRWDAASHSFVTTDDTPGRVAELLERLGVELEWSDEWACCDQCSKAVRTSADSYGWKPSYSQDNDGNITCANCIADDPTDYLKSLEGDCRRCVTLDIDLADHGYVLLEDSFEHGFHHGQDADPELIGAALREQGVERFLFTLDSTGEFDMSFSVWLHEDELAVLDRDAWELAPKDGPSVAAGLQRALADASRQMAELPDGGIKVSKVDARTGIARVRLASPQEFLDGTAMDF